MSNKMFLLPFGGSRFVSQAILATFLPLLICGGIVAGAADVSAQTTVSPPPSTSPIFRLGEKLTYTLSLGKIFNAGYAETYVASRGKLGGRDSVEIRSKMKTLDLVSAAFFVFDENRTVFAAPDTGLPLYITTDMHEGALPKVTVRNYLSRPTSSYDLLTLIYKAREAGGVGTFPLFEGQRLYTATFQPAGSITARTEIGNFDTNIFLVQSDFLTARGITSLYIHFSTDEARIPVVIRFTTSKGEVKAVISAIVPPEVDTQTSAPLPTPVPTPVPAATPKPTAVPEAYVENRPLAPELGFQIGESLDYRITTGGKPVASVTLNAHERKLFQNIDSLLLKATVTDVEPGTKDFSPGDMALVEVDPETLTPTLVGSKFVSVFPGLNQTVTFDKRTGSISFGGAQPIDAPIGTHSFLSLIYAMRSFNLKPSKDPNSPVNDTRVAVFWDSKNYVFTLRPSNPEVITINGEKVSAQMITVNTGNPDLDALGIKVWLSTDRRLPLRFSFGSYQAELVSRP